jgi:hypothetical protein
VTVGEKSSVQTMPEPKFLWYLSLKRTRGVQLGKTDFDKLPMRISEELVRNPHTARNRFLVRRAVINSYRSA